VSQAGDTGTQREAVISSHFGRLKGRESRHKVFMAFRVSIPCHAVAPCFIVQFDYEIFDQFSGKTWAVPLVSTINEEAT